MADRSLFGGSEGNSGQPDGEDFFGQIQQQHEPEQPPKPQAADDLTARWQAALAGDEFLADDSEGFLPSDDEGLLPDSDDEIPVQKPVRGPDGTLLPSPSVSTEGTPQAPPAAPQYTPQAQIPIQSSVQPQYGGTWPTQQPQQSPYHPYAPPQQAFQAPVSHMLGPPPTALYSPLGARPPTAPEKKAQSFVDKKEGYQSPYDFPLDIGPLAARKRTSNPQQSQSALPAGMGSMVSQPPPVRSSSIGAVFATGAPTQAQQPQAPPKPKAVPQQKFFEELPLVPPKRRATSALGRHPEPMNRGPSGVGSFQAAPPRPESTQGFYHSPQKTFALPVMGSPQRELAPQTTAAASRSSGMYTAPPPPAPPARYSPIPSTTMGRQSPPNTSHPPALSADLQRWQGAPVLCWGFGGTIAYTFPKRVQRYTSDLQQPVIKCSPGEVKIRSIKEILPFEESEGKFPGPAWSGSRSTNKAKKKELLTWFTDKIGDLERRALGGGTRAEEKVLLWKIVRTLLENDGVLEGNLEVEKTVRTILSPETVEAGMSDYVAFSAAGDISSTTQGPCIERADPHAVKTIKNNLLKGDRTAAIWHAVDRKLWSHALLISGTVGRDLWKQVVQEFVKSEVKTLGEGADSLATLYETFAGNWEECVDELVSPSARMGMPMLGASRSGSVNIDEKLGRWRETLGLILSNRSPGDVESVMALGKLLVGYDRVEAGHICYLFARQGALGSTGSVFSGHDDPAADFSLLGADHRQASFGRDTDSVMLSEVYELAVSLCATPSSGFPHLQSYKLQRAIVLAENGQRGDAQKYCDSITSSIKVWNKPSPYFHPGFFGGLEDLSTRLSMSPKDSSPSAGKWIPKLSSDMVSNSLWGTFNKFVAGEEEETSSTVGGEGSTIDAVAGPFAKIAGPGNLSSEISRVQSGLDLYSTYNNAPRYTPAPPTAVKPGPQAANRYAPSNSYQPKSGLHEPVVNPRATSDTYKPADYDGGYEPSSNPHTPQQQTVHPYDSSVPSSVSTGYPGASTYDSRSSFEDTALPTKPETMEDSASESHPPSGGYQPPSAGGYEPPSTGFTPYEPPSNDDDENEDDKPKPKKSIVDDGDEFMNKAAEHAMKLQEEEAKKAEEEKKNAAQGKKSWFGSWFAKRDPNQQGPIKAKLGEESSFVYDPDLKRWVNKKAGDTAAAAPKPAPPPKRASTPTSQPSSTASTPGFPPPGTSSAPPTSGLHAPPPPFGRSPTPSIPSTSTPPPPPAPPASTPPSTGPPGPGPPSRPPTSMSQRAITGDTIDDLLGPPGAPLGRKSTPGGGKKRGKSRYVEVIPGQS